MEGLITSGFIQSSWSLYEAHDDFYRFTSITYLFCSIRSFVISLDQLYLNTETYTIFVRLLPNYVLLLHNLEMLILLCAHTLLYPLCNNQTVNYNNILRIPVYSTQLYTHSVLPLAFLSVMAANVTVLAWLIRLLSPCDLAALNLSYVWLSLKAVPAGSGGN